MTGVSIIICTYNGELRIKKAIEVIKSLKTSFLWELIIVDNASNDDTSVLCREILINCDFKASLLYCAEPGKMNAFWLGVENSLFDFVLDCDDDNLLDPNYIEEGLKILLTNEKIGALGGCGYLPGGYQLPDWFTKYSKSYALGPQGIMEGEISHGAALYGAGTFFSKRALFKLKESGFIGALSCRKGEQLLSGGDTELCFAISLLKFQLWYSGRLRFCHAIDPARISWPYYLQLKKGISSSYPILAAYSRNFRFGVLGFRWFVFLSNLKMRFFLLKNLFYENESDLEVQKIICQTKLSTFKSNYRLALRQLMWAHKMRR